MNSSTEGIDTSSLLFRSLHKGPGILLIPNAWDAVSARLMERSGAKAIATTSAGIAWSCGYPDGGALPKEHFTAVICAIARVITLPLTVDIEAGYSQDSGAVAQLVAHIDSLGVAGINIEDGAAPPQLLCDKIAAIRKQLTPSGSDLFINARTDVYLREIASGEAAIEETIRRATRYRAAGCDGLFVPGLADTEAISAISAAIRPIPLNVMAVAKLPPVETLQRCGVRRLSAGSAISQAALGCTRRLVAGFLSGTLSGMFEESLDYGAVNELLGGQP